MCPPEIQVCCCETVNKQPIPSTLDNWRQIQLGLESTSEYRSWHLEVPKTWVQWGVGWQDHDQGGRRFSAFCRWAKIYWVVDCGYGILIIQLKVLDTGYWILDTDYWTQVLDTWILDIEYWMAESQPRRGRGLWMATEIPDTGH